MLKDMIDLDVIDYLKRVYLNVFIVTALSVGIIYLATPHIANPVINLIVSCVSCVLLTGLSIVYVGMSKQERATLSSKIVGIRRKFTRHD